MIGREWRTIPGYSRYEVSSCGIIRKIEDGRVLKQSVTDEEYLQVKLVNDTGKRDSVKAHRAVALAFHGQPPSPEQNEVRHLDGNRQHNAAGNLEWGTRQENADDVVRHGSQQTHKFVLTEADRDAIRRSNEPGAVLMARYGISKSTLSRYRTGATRRRTLSDAPSPMPSQSALAPLKNHEKLNDFNGGSPSRTRT